MTKFLKSIVLWLMVLGLSTWLGCLVSTLRADYAGITQLRQDLDGLKEARAANRVVEKLRWQNEELAQLRESNQELHRLRQEIQRLREAEAKRKRELVQGEEEQLQKLRQDNQRVREENLQLERAPETIQAEQTLDVNRLKQIAKAFRLYAEVNPGQSPGNFNELKFYTPAEVFQALEPGRYEILAVSGAADIAEPDKTPLLRSKAKDKQNLRAYLFADGHLEMKSEE
ncbi:MAG: hypothetical protein JWR69_1924 [Pedosphaera sp.]|nr:hypothetical protein [Pedosphaera sp.]